MQVTFTFKPKDRTEWRFWLEEHHASASEIWLLFDDRPEERTVSYLDAVEEAICFGWIDSIQKRHSLYERAQRFTPRKKMSNWTERNKERARRLIQLGFMTDAGRATLPDLNVQFAVAEDIVNALKAEPNAWSNFLSYPELYQRVRIGYNEDMRKNQSEFERRLHKFVKQTAANQMFGNWNDGGRLG
ncbi:MAG: YdeI/OmpD-associated family protein [Anaerolineaceae bacterium]|nr:YdeI/OmpD-associated family protein [Anaerolineaceae bacterium]